jgi:hypothetical protein
MSLEFLSGIGAPKRKQARQVKRQAKKTARVEKKAVKVERKALKKGKVNARQMRALVKKAPATAARIKKMVVDQTRRAKMEEQAEPLVSTETPNVDEQAENEVLEEAQENFDEGVEEVDAPEFEGSGNPDSDEGGADMGVIYPNYYALSGRKNKAQRQAKKTQRKAKKTVRKAKRKEKIKKFAKGAVKIGLAPGRKAFLALIKIGKKTEKFLKFNLAKKLAPLYKFDNGASLSKFWAKFGGKPDELKNAIIKGGATINGVSFGVATEVLVTSASPILVALVALIADINKKKKAQGEQVTEEETQAPEMEVNTEVETGEEVSGLNKFRLQKLKAMRLKQYNQE